MNNLNEKADSAKENLDGFAKRSAEPFGLSGMDMPHPWRPSEAKSPEDLLAQIRACVALSERTLKDLRTANTLIARRVA